MLRGHVGSLELIRGVFNPVFRRNFTATSVRCTDDNDRKKVEGVFSWLKDIFKSEVRVEEARNSIDVQIKDTPKGYPRNFAHNIQSCSSPEVTSRVKNNMDTKLNSTSESISHFGWYPSPLSRNLLLVAQRMDAQIRGVANCSPRNTKPPIREPNMPEKQQRKDDKEKKKKKKKPVLRTGASEEFPDIVAMEAGQGLTGNPDVNFRYQWGIKIPEEMAQATQDVHRKYIWDQASLPLTDNPKGLGMKMSTSDTEKSSAKTETVGPGQPAQSMEPSAVDETVEAVDKKVPEKMVKKATEPSKDSPSDEDYNIPTGAEFDAEISAWKDLALKSKVPVDTSNKDEFVSDTKTSANMLSIRPEAPEPKLDVQAVPSTNEDVMKDKDEADTSKEVKVNLKKLDGKRTGDVQKMDSKKLHTSQTYNLESSLAATEDHCSSRTKPRAWSWETMSGLPRLNVVTFSTSSESWASAEKINDTTGSEAALAGKPTSHDGIGNMDEVASPDQPQLLRQSQQYQTGQPEIDSDFEDSLNVIADRGVEISLQRTHGEQEIDDSKMNMADKDSMAMEAEYHHQHPNSLTQFEDDFVSGYESMSLEPTQEKSAKEDQKKEQPTDSDAFDNESPVTNRDNYVSDGEYVKVPGDPYPYSKQYFEKWRMAKEEIDIGGSFVDTTVKDDNAEVPIGDTRTRQIDNLPPTRNISHDMHMRNQMSRGKDETLLQRSTVTDNNLSASSGLKRGLGSKSRFGRRRASRFCVSSLDRRLIPECLRRETPEKYFLIPRSAVTSWSNRTTKDQDDWLSKEQPIMRSHERAKDRLYSGMIEVDLEETISTVIKTGYKVDRARGIVPGETRNTLMTDNPTSLSNPNSGGDSSLSSSMHAMDGVDKPEDRRAEDDKSSSRERTIHPDSHNTMPGNNISKPNVSEARKGLDTKSRGTDLVMSSTSNDKRIKEENIHVTRQKHLSSVSKREIEEIYERKNYSYLQPEEMKNLCFSVPRTKDQPNQ